MWYYTLDNQKKGPVDKDEIQRLISDGDLGMDDLVWTNGMDDWTPVSEVEDLCPSPPPLPQEESSSTSKGSFSSSTSKGINSQSHSRTTGQPTSGRGAAETSAASTENSDPYAGFGRRSIAYAIDGLILFVFFFAIGALIITTSSGTQRSGNPRALEGGLRIVGFFLTWMYFALNESSRKQATWGKQLMGLKVTDLSGHKIGFWKATGRHFGKILSGMILLIGFIMAAFTEKKQALHDKMAGCLVIEGSEENQSPSETSSSVSTMNRKQKSTHAEPGGGAKARRICPTCETSHPLDQEECSRCGTRLGGCAPPPERR